LENLPLEEKEKSPAVVIKVDEGGRVCVQTEEKDITTNGKKKYQLSNHKKTFCKLLTL
jgi:hypothetical protein